MSPQQRHNGRSRPSALHAALLLAGIAHLARAASPADDVHAVLGRLQTLSNPRYAPPESDRRAYGLWRTWQRHAVARGSHSRRSLQRLQRHRAAYEAWLRTAETDTLAALSASAARALRAANVSVPAHVHVRVLEPRGRAAVGALVALADFGQSAAALRARIAALLMDGVLPPVRVFLLAPGRRGASLARLKGIDGGGGGGGTPVGMTDGTVPTIASAWFDEPGDLLYTSEYRTHQLDASADGVGAAVGVAQKLFEHDAESVAVCGRGHGGAVALASFMMRRDVHTVVAYASYLPAVGLFRACADGAPHRKRSGAHATLLHWRNSDVVNMKVATESRDTMRNCGTAIGAHTSFGSFPRVGEMQGLTLESMSMMAYRMVAQKLAPGWVERPAEPPLEWELRTDVDAMDD